MKIKNVEELNRQPESLFYDTRELERSSNAENKKDDYGSSRVPGNWRFSAWNSAWSWMGLSTALAYPLTGALLTLSFGATNVMIGFLLSMILVGVGVYITSLKATNEGVGKDLMSRGSYGYMGSVVNTLIIGFYLMILFSLETSVMAKSIHEFLPNVPYWIFVSLIVVCFIPLGIYGMVFIARLQTATFVLYVIGIALVFAGLFSNWSELANAAFAGEWWKLNPNGVPTTWLTVLGATGAWMGAFGFMNIFAGTDFTRMTRRSEAKKGAVIQVVINSVINSFLIGAMGIFFLAATNGTNPDPGVTFVWVLGPLGLFLVLVTQLRGNVLNMYLGTIAFENVITQITKKNIARSKILIPFVILGFIIVISPVLAHFSTIATFAGVVFAAWVGSTFGEWTLVRPKYKIPKWLEIRRAYLPDINKIGLTSLIAPIIIGLIATFGGFGTVLQSLAVFFTLILAFILPAIIAAILGEEKTVKQYFSRLPEIPNTTEETLSCAVTGAIGHKSDFVKCPFHENNWISSSTCATEMKCNKMCQTSGIPSSVPADPTF
ncbi:purine-cytosine permease family protein [Niallia sp. Krafla_26]|uniref:purine-cytosine permease family protein n=1 Tax=Niallia sp. Krafla_26 TaxID=3064703 RepID=UPI003D170876